jgi:hypothetical protein
MRKRIQLILLVFVVLAGIRLLLIYRERRAPVSAPNAARPTPALNADDYVVPTQVHSTDLKSAKEDLAGKTVWVKAGNQVNYFPYSAGHVDFKHSAGLLPPLKKLAITNVIQSTDPGAKAEEIAPGVRVRTQRVLAVFKLDGDAKTYAVAIGGNRGGDYTLYINDMFFLDDPHQLYRHWPADVWTAIDQHQALTGMNELQTAFALGAGVPDVSGGDFGNRTLKFDNNGHPVTVTFERNRATRVVPGS